MPPYSTPKALRCPIQNLEGCEGFASQPRILQEGVVEVLSDRGGRLLCRCEAEKALIGRLDVEGVAVTTLIDIGFEVLFSVF